MPLRLTARVITQLGAELISSDAVALFELVKNGFDAGSTSVAVDVMYAADHLALNEIEEALSSTFQATDFDGAVAADVAARRFARPGPDGQPLFLLQKEVARQLDTRLRNAQSLAEGRLALRSLNRIEIADSGCGMTLEEVDDYFLTVGTMHRQRQHEDNIKRGIAYPNNVPLAGEKGIGRFSAMRLGLRLDLETWTSGADYETQLAVDWRWFYDNPESDPSDYELTPNRAERRHPQEQSGTRLLISDLTSPWPQDKIILLASLQLAKFVDPFTEGTRRIRLRWNGLTVDVRALTRAYLEAAPNGMTGSVTIDEEGAFHVDVDFWFTRQSAPKQRFEFSRRYDVDTFGEITNAQVAHLGPLSFELYHYNRNRLEAIPTVATREEVRDWLNEWSGGLMLYRDNLRVLPYGNHPEDDWLELDQRALRGKGFRVNRIQVVGCVRISRVQNPELRDQTNREGLQENEASKTLHELMRRLVSDCFVALYREKVEETSAVDSAHLVGATIEAEENVSKALERFLDAVRSEDAEAVALSRRELLAAVNQINELAAAIEVAAATHQLQRIEVTELAAKGLAAEAMAHDVEAVLDSSITEAGVIIRQARLEERLKTGLQHLVAVLKSARVQIAGIKPGPTKRRRRRSTFDLCKVIREVAGIFDSRFVRHNITFTFSVRPREGSLFILAVEGHIRQILENLFRNSIYWALDRRNKDERAQAKITFRCDVRNSTLAVRDSGPGFAPEETEWVFVAFNTHRPRGHGLGLAIARDLAQFNRIDVQVDTSERNAKHRFSGLVLDFSRCLEDE